MADYYFDGNDGNDTTGEGKEANPYKSIKASTIGGVFNPANARFFVKRGSTVLVAQEIHPNGSFKFAPYGDGDAAAKVVYNYGGSYFIAVGTGAASTDVIEFTDLTLQDDNTSSLSIAVYQNNTGSGKIVVTDCKIYDFYNAIQPQRGTGHQIARNEILRFRNNGIIVEHVSVAAPSNCLIEDNYIDARLANGTVALNDCITLHAGASNGQGNIIRRNTLVAGEESCIDIATQYPGTLVEDNVCYARSNSTSISWADIYCAGANSLINRNLVFANYRPGVQLAASGIEVCNNIVVSPTGYGASPLVYASTGATSANVHNNFLIGRSGYNSSLFLAAAGIVPGQYHNNYHVNYSAAASFRMLAFAAADLTSWTINNNRYSIMAGSLATPFLGSQSFAQWQARTGSPDANSATDTVARLLVPDYSSLGQKFNMRKLLSIAASNPLVGAGRHLRYSRDINNKQFWNPPAIGPVDYRRP